MNEFEDIRIIGVITEEIGTPRNDESAGSALYSIPFRLSRSAPAEWASAFVAAWDRPSSFTTMHRPGICAVRGDRVILNRTTIDEVERTHKKTLLLAAEAANKHVRAAAARAARQQQERQHQESEHQRHVREVADRIRFDEDE